MSRTNIYFILALIVVIAGIGFFTFSGSSSGGNNGEVQSVASQIQKGDTLPYTDLDGNPVDLAQYEGNTLVINAWASWCPFCVNELPDMEELAAQYADQNVKVIAINRGESAATAKAFVEQRLGNPENIIFLLDSGDKFYKSIGGFSMPETLFYKQGGETAVHKRGFMELAEMEQHVQKALAVNE